MKLIICMFLFFHGASYAQESIQLKDLGKIDYDQAYKDMESEKEKGIHSEFQSIKKKSAEQKLKNQEAQTKALRENSNHNPRRKMTHRND